MLVPRRRAFTIVDLLTVLTLVALFGVATLAAIDKTREVDNRIACGKNLRMIGQAMLLYANENKGIFPRTRYDPDVAAWPAYTGWRVADPFAKDSGPDANDVTAPLFLLVRTMQVPAQAFVCPTTDARAWDFAAALAKEKRATQGDRANFPSPVFLSYSIANPYPNRAAVNSGYRWNITVDAAFALAADMNPGGKALADLTPDAPADKLKDGNSPNHDRQGQNVLYGDGHVEFLQSPFAGAARDNIYTVSGSDDGKIPNGKTTVGSPRWKLDSVLLPTADEKGDEKAAQLSPAIAEGKPAAIAVPDGRLTTAQGNIQGLTTALEVYEIDTGHFPTTAQALAALTAKPVGEQNWHGPYIATPAAKLKDPWGNPYHYRAPGVKNSASFDLWSDGPDGKSGTGDDVKNW